MTAEGFACVCVCVYVRPQHTVSHNTFHHRCNITKNHVFARIRFGMHIICILSAQCV